MITASSSTDNRYNQLLSQLLQSQISSSGNVFSKNHKLMLVTCSGGGELVTSGSRQYCKTLNVSVPLMRAKQNREIKGREYQLQAKTGRNYYCISNCMVLINQNGRGQNNFAC